MNATHGTSPFAIPCRRSEHARPPRGAADARRGRLEQRRAGEGRELERLLREPDPGGRIDDATPLGVRDRAADATIARTVRLARDLDPEIRVGERPARLCGGTQPDAA